MVALFGPLLAEAILGSIAVGPLVLAWLAARAGGAEDVEWLYYHGGGIALNTALSVLLEQIWAEGWRLGESAAAVVLGLADDLPSQVLEDLLNSLAYEWVGQIARTLLEGIARVLASGGTQAQLEAKLREFLSNEGNAKRIVQTELTRAINAAAAAYYRQHKITQVRWVTEHDANVCAECDANEAAGPWTLGTPFPSGAIAPPQHPRCRCALMPA